MIDIPKLGMGTWGMGGKYERDDSNIEESISILRQGIELGIRMIDVAELYGKGLSEEIVGQAIKGYSRKDLFIISKVWHTNLAYDDVLKACEFSLKRLQTEYLDLYLIHWPSQHISLSHTMSALEYLYKQKLIKGIGVSNFDTTLMEEAQKYLKDRPLDANQFEYNLIRREAEKEIIPYCQLQNINMIAYRPLVKGDLSWVDHTVILELSRKYSKSPIQIAINWLISQNITTIPKSSNLKHLKENLGALGWNLSDDDVELIKGINIE